MCVFLGLSFKYRAGLGLFNCQKSDKNKGEHFGHLASVLLQITGGDKSEFPMTLIPALSTRELYLLLKV